MAKTSFDVDPELWKKFKEVANKKRQKRGPRLNQLIEKDIKENAKLLTDKEKDSE